jgi:hypothetical protein
VAAHDFEKGLALPHLDVELDDEGNFAHGLFPH